MEYSWKDAWFVNYYISYDDKIKSARLKSLTARRENQLTK